jgi:hypothetical protein
LSLQRRERLIAGRRALRAHLFQRRLELIAAGKPGVCFARGNVGGVAMALPVIEAPTKE